MYVCMCVKYTDKYINMISFHTSISQTRLVHRKAARVVAKSAGIKPCVLAEHIL